MIAFQGGPADGVRLNLRRIVFFLRVVWNVAGEWDALDQPHDTVGDGETAHVYRHVKTTGTAFVDGVDPKTRRRTGWVEHSAVYEYHGIQPDQATLRDNAVWSKWCHEQPEAERFK